MTITLRRATVADAAALSSLAARLFEQTFGAENTASNMQDYLAHAFTTERQEAELAWDDRMVWLAEDERKTPVGYASLLVDSEVSGVSADRPAEIERIYVDRPLQGTGLGARLMEACVAYAENEGCDAIWLAVWERNPRAIAFYERNGFTRVGAKTFQLGDDVQQDYVMSRSLA